MKTLITFFAIIIAFCNVSYAQRLNGKGQQMVQSIKVYNENEELYVYSFYYDAQNRLIKLTNYGNYFNYEIWYENETFHKKIEGNLKDGTWSQYRKYIYEIDSNRNIIKKIDKCYDYDMIGYERWDYDFTYGYPANDTIYQVVKEEETFIPVMVIKGKPVMSDEYRQTSFYEFSFENGNEHRFWTGQRWSDGRISSFHTEKGGFTSYTSYRNMTNLSMNYVLWGYLTTEYAECATEWCNHYSYCLPEGMCGNYFVYHFREDEPYSLYEVDDYYGNGVLRYKFVIEYVDE